ncbi:MAG: hypothetical protein RLZZ135_1861 [Cyanobacteriota bacterium]|jgi:hypothetical protein
MKLADLSAVTRQKIAKVKWDGIFEKHEGPYDWNWLFKTTDDENDLAFLTITSGTLRERRLPSFDANLSRTLCQC